MNKIEGRCKLLPDRVLCTGWGGVEEKVARVVAVYVYELAKSRIWSANEYYTSFLNHSLKSQLILPLSWSLSNLLLFLISASTSSSNFFMMSVLPMEIASRIGSTAAVNMAKSCVVVDK